MIRTHLSAGIDVGSTTLKIAIVDPVSKELLHAVYRRHGAKQAACARELLAEAHGLFPDAGFNVAVCGSGGRIVAKAIKAHYIQEVVANSLAIREFFPETRVAIELGGQDAKVVFFHHDQHTGKLMASDMRMNGSCAGGTGAFVDEVASLLKITTTEFNGYAEGGTTVYPISGRCGVFAKTDIQPLLNQGVSRQDIALSTFHAIAKQTIGGLAQGMEIVPPVIFEGGPLTFNPMLVRVFAERLGLTDDQIILPERPEMIVAHGTALAVEVMFQGAENLYRRDEALAALARPQSDFAEPEEYEALPYFASHQERTAFELRHPETKFEVPSYPRGTELRAWLGIDAGSTTSKFVLLDENEEVVYRFYSNNNGTPLKIVQLGLLECYRYFEERGVELKILGAGTTGYGEGLFASAFKADFHTVETVAHAEAALKYSPGASFILDIGGQDMKAISLAGGIVTGIVLNEACSAGCGSFLETYASSLEIPVEEIASRAFSSKSPAQLGSRCTIFMNSSIITEQKNGKSPDDIMAGLCKSIIENVFTKVIRIANLDALGDTVVVQGGTFKNDAVLRAFEQYSSKRIIRAPFPGEMGAIGIALLTRQEMITESGTASGFIGREGLGSFSFTKEPGYICPFCSNNCNRTLVTFADGSTFVTGNRCERGEIIGDARDPQVRERLKATSSRLDAVPDMMHRRRELLFADYDPRPVSPPKEYSIGLPRVLEFWESMPFWRALFSSLGFRVVLSRESGRKLYEKGLKYVPSDTACFPGKVAHGHLMDLIEKRVDRIFMPMMLRAPSENPGAVSNYLCSVVQGYPLILRESHEPAAAHGIPMDTPAFHWYDRHSRDMQLYDYFATGFNIPRSIVAEALKEADRAQSSFRATLEEEGRQILEEAERSGTFAVVLAGRPYHNDFLVNHDLSHFFVRQGIPVLTIDSLPGFSDVDLTRVRAETVINFHVRMFEAALIAAEHPALELAQIVSFGCGHDAVISDEIVRIMKEAGGKDPLVLKLDESDVPGPLNIRVKSFIETVRAKRRRGLTAALPVSGLCDPFPAKYLQKDRTERTIMVPTLSPTFTQLAAAVISREGYRTIALPLAGRRAIELGKKYVHNDMCFPAQLNIGEALAYLEQTPDPNAMALGLAHFECDCRLAHYAGVARKALDDAGYPQVPIITTGSDKKGIHPGLKLGISFQLRMLVGILIGDNLDGMARRIRPYEKNPGETDRVHRHALERMTNLLSRGIGGVFREYRRAVEAFNKIPLQDIPRKPRVFVIGEILINYHPSSNAHIESYLEKNGMEVIMPPMIDVFKKDAATVRESMRRFYVRFPLPEALQTVLTDTFIDFGINYIEALSRGFRFFEPKDRYDDLAGNVEGLVDKVFNSGKGWLIPADIIEHTRRGVNSFIIIQPFGCLPNHITGRGIVKSVKKQYPHIQVLSLDFDPDTSLANVENRLQMLIINARELEKRTPSGSVEPDRQEAVEAGADGLRPQRGEGL